MRPPISYYGSKARIAPRIADMLPRHEHYIEPFAGSLAVLLAKRPAKMETVNDLDQRLVTFWRVLRDRGEELARVCALTPHARAEHAAAPQAVSDELETARRVWVQLTQGRTGTLRPTGWRHHVAASGSSISMATYLDAYVARITPAMCRLHAVSLECRPALDVITAYGHHRDALLYVDPPYLGATRARNYRTEMPTERSHRELAEALGICRATVVLSGYPSDLYDNWHRVELNGSTTQGTTSTTRSEVLWSNQPLNTQPALFTGGSEC